MFEQEVTVTTRYGRMPAFAAWPGEGTYPPVIFYMDAPGIREELRNMARRIAKQGYYCLLPDLYYRYGTIRLDLPRRNDAISAIITACRLGTTNANVADDTSGMIGFLDGQANTRPGPIGCVGYCLSGQFIVTVAAKFPHRIAGAASMYGIEIVTDKEDSPHKNLAQIKNEMYFGFAENDKAVPAETVTKLKAALDAAGNTYQMDVFPGTQHAFGFPERDVYHPIAAEQAWSKVFGMWERTLRGAAAR
jgi:carboxymethylenebutenolidase